MTPERLAAIKANLDDARRELAAGGGYLWTLRYHSDVAPLLAALEEARTLLQRATLVLEGLHPDPPVEPESPLLVALHAAGFGDER